MKGQSRQKSDFWSGEKKKTKSFYMWQRREMRGSCGILGRTKSDDGASKFSGKKKEKTGDVSENG